MASKYGLRGQGRKLRWGDILLTSLITRDSILYVIDLGAPRVLALHYYSNRSYITSMRVELCHVSVQSRTTWRQHSHRLTIRHACVYYKTTSRYQRAGVFTFLRARIHAHAYKYTRTSCTLVWEFRYKLHQVWFFDMGRTRRMGKNYISLFASQ